MFSVVLIERGCFRKPNFSETGADPVLLKFSLRLASLLDLHCFALYWIKSIYRLAISVSLGTLIKVC